MKTTNIFLLLGVLIPLCTVVTSFVVKLPENGQKPGVCPQERYYIKVSNPEIIHHSCKNDFDCDNNMKCCVDNLHTMCKAPAQERSGQCPTYDSTFTASTKCNDNCTADSECPGNWKCCFKKCGKTCTPTQSDLGNPSAAIPITMGFCQQGAPYSCAKPERSSCDNSSCTDGYKCCPFICRRECRKVVSEKDGKCPAEAGCPAGDANNSCTSDYDCKTLHKCCSTACGKKCLFATTMNYNIHYPINPLLL